MNAEPSLAQPPPTVDSSAEFAAIRARLQTRNGDEFWRELEALAGEPGFQDVLQREFPSQAPRFVPDVQRRDFLRLMGASLGVMGLAACTRQPDEKILPFARSPEYLIPGKPLYFATALTLGGCAQGLLVESHMGRPTKIEGNPDHPSSLGATDALAQAAILSLYDPDRSHSCLRAGQIGTWNAFTTELAGRLEALAARQGEGLAVLHAGEASPFLSAQLGRLVARFPKLRSYRWTPLHRDQERAGAELAFGRDVAVRYRFDKARVVLALDADFLAAGPGAVRYARDFAGGRMGRSYAAGMNRLYAVESTYSVTGAMADERLSLRPSELEGFARALAKELGLAVEAPALDARRARFARAAAKDLSQNVGAGVVLAGSGADPVVHALAHLVNERLRNAGSTVEYSVPLEVTSEPAAEGIRRLVEDTRAHRIDTLVILSGNPVYDAPAELDFAAALAGVPFRVHLAAQVNETSALCHWHVPEAHFLESWSDARAHDGTASIVQPLIAPLYEAGGVKSAHELVALLASEAGTSAYQLLRAQWQAASGKSGEEFEAFWRAALNDGVIAGTTFPALDVKPRADLDLGAPKAPENGLASGLELVLRADASAFDGRFANNAWLQELPRPITRLTWENAALLAPATATRLGLEPGDVVTLAAGGKSVRAPVWSVPGHAEDTLTLHLGYGRKLAGKLGTGLGFDAYALRTGVAPWRVGGVKLTKTGERAALATVQKQPDQEQRNLARVATFERFKAEGKLAFAGKHDSPFDQLAPPSLYPGFPYEGYAWGMVIDLNACLGCNACMVACQSENNIPVVGKDQILNGREMHWIRVDRYFEPSVTGSTETIVHQPVPCMHCENAPCETVCPVGATVHSDEGLNEMVYNRCVGTRYCSNNCPYKVRRFNFFPYADFETESLKMQRNPDVTVRSRGVMEKCTYCVQRISQARIQAKKEERAIREGEIVSACQAVCPTQAITFGDINDQASAISKLRGEPHHYGLLAELGTRPRTTYLGKLRNPNPELAENA
ncbi:MAG: 4Fe-4S dicluster domain-containing protein [Planctomycetes bacterium]|nr:4Fe-4S dicluster domain-containing protein [Planctomycetota bacterium]